MQTQTEGIGELSDPEFMTLWSSARAALALTPPGSPERETAKAEYAALAAEYRARIDGGA